LQAIQRTHRITETVWKGGEGGGVFYSFSHISLFGRVTCVRILMQKRRNCVLLSFAQKRRFPWDASTLVPLSGWFSRGLISAPFPLCDGGWELSAKQLSAVSYQLSVKARGVRGLLSHPFARKKAKGWGTEHWWKVMSGTARFVLSQVSKSRPAAPMPLSEIEMWSTRHLV